MRTTSFNTLLSIIYKHVFTFSLVWTSVIFILCATPGQYIPTANWLELLSFDKLVHAGIFFVLSVLFFLVQVKYHQQLIWRYVYFLTAVLYGILLELMQARYFSNRSADWKDALADAFGCLIALIFFKRILRFFVSET